MILPRPDLLQRSESSTETGTRTAEAVDLKTGISELLAYCRRHQWAGWDPYDGLKSELFRSLPPLQNKFCRRVVIQLMKRSPLNLRPLARVAPSRNAKGLALIASSLARLSRIGLTDLDEAVQLGDEVVEMSLGEDGYCCWGYPFDWQTRSVLVPSTIPNIVCTTFVAQALLDLYEATGRESYRTAAESAGWFVVDRLARDLPEDEFCIRYQVLQDTKVHNASLLGAALLARLSRLQGEERFRDVARKACRYSLDRQAADGSWPYSEHPGATWIDSFHTGYNLLALLEIGRAVEVDGLEKAVAEGFRFYRDHFFREDGIVRYYHDRTNPVDAHAIGHALLTLAEFSDRDPGALALADKVWDWASRNMRAAEGWFFYQKWGRLTIRIPYLRWSQAWMLVGMTELAVKRERAGLP